MRFVLPVLLLTLTACGTGRTVVLDQRDAGSTARDAGFTTRDAGFTTRDAGSIDSGVREPQKHRPVAPACEMERATWDITPNPNAPNECTQHSDCTAGANGRCTGTRFEYICTYDQCFSDDDCPTVCLCEQGVRSTANRCLSLGACAVDADCGPGNFCSPTFSDCGEFSGVVGYFCHTPQDECVDDSDCGAAPWYCRYEQSVARWTCSDSQCAG